MTPLAIRVPVECAAAIRREALRRDVFVSDILRELIAVKFGTDGDVVPADYPPRQR
jgi:hypothetical protein